MQKSLRPASDRGSALFLLFLFCFVLGGGTSRLNAQMSAQGSIEGKVTDPTGSIVPGVSVVVTNLETGASRTVVTNAQGLFRVPLLNPASNYQVEAELPGFKRYVQSGISLRAGQVVSVPIVLEVGELTESVTVTSDVSVVNATTADIGRVMDSKELHALPLISRNPYNLGLLQAGVVGRENSEFGVPRFSANGMKSRVNYRLDGNTNTQKDRPGLRLQPLSELFIREVQLVNNGFNAEFGRTTGIVYNAVTRSGTNDFHGEASYRFRRDDFSAFPFSASPFPEGAEKPPTDVDNYTAAIGGPILSDRWHFFTGYERSERDLAGQRTISVAPETIQALGLDATKLLGDGTQGTGQDVDFFLVRSDLQINQEHKFTSRYNLFRNTSPNNVGGGLNTREVSIDFDDKSDSYSNQLVSIFSPSLLNEFRFQFSRRLQTRDANELSGTGPHIQISGVANFGAPDATGNTAPGQKFSQKIWQYLDHMTYNTGSHSVKFGVDIQRINDSRSTPIGSRFIFPSIEAYLDAVSGRDPFSFTSFRQRVGNPEIDYDSTFYAFFVQDEWNILPNLRLNYGLRYDLFDPPGADSDSLLEISRDFNLDKNNFAPRLGMAYSFGDTRKTVIRASVGIFYDAPPIKHFEDALQQNGTASVLRLVNLDPGSPLAPAFPNSLSQNPESTSLDILAVDPDFANLYSSQANLQIEQEINRDISVTVGYIYSKGSRIPVRRNTNVVPTGQTLADGRPIFGSERFDPRFNNIRVVESVGNSTYNAGFLQLNKRFSHGVQATVSYTYSHAIDDAPEVNILEGEGEISDPTNRSRERGNSRADLRHNLTFSTLLQPRVEVENRFLNYLLNNNQLSLIGRFTSGEFFSVTGNRNINGLSGTAADRPLFIGRNTENLPNWEQIDLRYVRTIPIRENYNIEVFGEFTNLFNHRNVVNQIGTVAVNTDGSLVNSLPTSFRDNTFNESRQFQLGFKFVF